MDAKVARVTGMSLPMALRVEDEPPVLCRLDDNAFVVSSGGSLHLVLLSTNDTPHMQQVFDVMPEALEEPEELGRDDDLASAFGEGDGGPWGRTEADGLTNSTNDSTDGKSLRFFKEGLSFLDRKKKSSDTEATSTDGGSLFTGIAPFNRKGGASSSSAKTAVNKILSMIDDDARSIIRSSRSEVVTAVKMMFVAEINILFVHTSTGALRCHGYDPVVSACFPANVLMEKNVIDFDICRTAKGILGAALFRNGAITTFTYSRRAVCVLSQFNPAMEGSGLKSPQRSRNIFLSKCKWVSSYLLCCYSGEEGTKSGYRVFSSDTGESLYHIDAHPGPNQRLLCTPILDGLTRFVPGSTSSAFKSTFRNDDIDSVPFFVDHDEDEGDPNAPKVVHLNQFAVLSFHTDLRLQYTIDVYQAMGADFIGVASIPLVSLDVPVSIATVGPWMMVSLPYGIEIYGWHGGDFIHSLVDDSYMVGVSWESQCPNFVRKTAENSYKLARRDLAVSNEYRDGIHHAIRGHCITTRPVVDVIIDMMMSGNFQTIQPTDLMRFGVNCGCSPSLVYQQLASYNSTEPNMGKQSSNILFNEYGTFLGKFVHLKGDPAQKVDVSVHKYCRSCGNKFSVFEKAHRCGFCAIPYCDSCAVKVNLRQCGYHNIPADAPLYTVCTECSLVSDQSLYLLAAARRYTQVIQYIVDNADICTGFEFYDVLSVVLGQCFLDGRYRECASLIAEYVSDPAEWQQWIIKFGGVQQLGELAKAIDVERCDIATNTMMLAQVCKKETMTLRVLVRQWPVIRYDPHVVATTIEQQLLKRRAECERLQAHLETQKLNARDRRTSVGLLYLDHDTVHLMLSLLHIYSSTGEDVNLVRSYILHFDQFIPSAEELLSRRPRLDAVHEAHLSWNSPRQSGELTPYAPTPSVFTYFCEERRKQWKVTNIVSELIDIVDFIKERNLFPIVLMPHENDFALLMTMLRRHAEAVSEFLQRIGRDACEKMLEVILRHLANHPREQLYILDTLTQRNPALTSTYHSPLAFLYIEYRPDRLMGFLRDRQITNVEWKKLFFETRERRMFAEMVYVVGRMGNDKEAVRIAVRNLKDVRFALQYVADAASSDSESLWKDLMNHVLQNGELVGAFLDHVALYRDPVEFLSKIPDDNRLRIPNEGKRLSRIMEEKSLDVRLVGSSVEAIEGDNFRLMMQHRRLQRKAVRSKVPTTGSILMQQCGICSTTLAGQYIAIANCGHMFHPECICNRFDTDPFSLEKRNEYITYCRGDPHEARRAARAHKGREVRRQRTTDILNAGKQAIQHYADRKRDREKDVVKLVPPQVLRLVIQFLPEADRTRFTNVSCHWFASMAAAEMDLREMKPEKPIIRGRPAIGQFDSDTDPFAHYAKLKRTKRCPTYSNTVITHPSNFGDDVFEVPLESESTGPRCPICNAN